MMEAGRELDALVAEKIMGEPPPTYKVPGGVLQGVTEISSRDGNWIGTTSGYDSGDMPVWVPKPYSTDIAAAWEVVEKVAMMAVQPDRGASHTIYGAAVECEGQYRWSASFGIHHAKARKAPHAICLAALEALGQKI